MTKYFYYLILCFGQKSLIFVSGMVNNFGLQNVINSIVELKRCATVFAWTDKLIRTKESSGLYAAGVGDCWGLGGSEEFPLFMFY